VGKDCSHLLFRNALLTSENIFSLQILIKVRTTNEDVYRHEEESRKVWRECEQQAFLSIVLE